ncbi:hypothetical protein Amet_1892 [Alkaliphilus metalliredigens QYMF]|uniref:Uncharacterized protein n=1 Tax=Alkaliphilus metalliredigens (strain QYMF) TaxID=293826 RepID=A6TPD9_ALKMQ|nr:hypothetical protein [Alkaliphilus metalliredigens]ABR48057.1 hypothetical protein Amet_1892 [Alkaliphilus metalliredigens QYMF]
MWRGILILGGFIAVVETYGHIKKQRKEKNATYLNLQGKFLEWQVINRPYTVYYRHVCNVRNLYILVYYIENSHGEIVEVNMAQSEYYNGVDRVQDLNKGDEVHMKLKKYPDESLYIFMENL